MSSISTEQQSTADRLAELFAVDKLAKHSFLILILSKSNYCCECTTNPGPTRRIHMVPNRSHMRSLYPQQEDKRL